MDVTKYIFFAEWNTSSEIPIGLVLLETWSDSPDGYSTVGLVGGVLGCFRAAI